MAGIETNALRSELCTTDELLLGALPQVASNTNVPAITSDGRVFASTAPDVVHLTERRSAQSGLAASTHPFTGTPVTLRIDAVRLSTHVQLSIAFTGAGGAVDGFTTSLEYVSAVPAGYRPGQTVVTPILIGVNGTTEWGLMTISSAGDVTVTRVVNGSAFTGTLTFPDENTGVLYDTSTVF